MAARLLEDRSREPHQLVSFCLDSWAVLAWLDGDEPAATAVDEALERERPAMS